MLKYLELFCWLFLSLQAGGQSPNSRKRLETQKRDSAQLSAIAQEWEFELPTLSSEAAIKSESEGSFFPSLLTANRDVFTTAASFHFGVARFKNRGYDAGKNTVLINGISMNSLDDGNIQWGIWSGLNEATRKSQLSLTLRANEFSIGNIGNAQFMDTRASRQREQTKFVYTFSNRSFTHRWMFSQAKNFSPKGWAWSINLSYRYAGEGSKPGTGYQSGSFFIALDKQLARGHLLSMSVFAASVTNEKQSPVLEESLQLSGTHLYNAYWGYQAGKKRNANIGRSFQPLCILTHEQQIDNHTYWTSSLGFFTGEKSSSGLDWYKAADPRPDYYRYLPSWQQDSVIRNAINESILQDNSQLQINWDRLYQINRNSRETVMDANGISGNSVTGIRSHYIQEERVASVRRWDFSTNYHSQLMDGITFNCGLSLQVQHSRFFKRIADLLGGEYYVDWNQFAERDFPNDPLVIQNDLYRPNRILSKNDKFGYDFGITSHAYRSWAQIYSQQHRLDMFAALGLSHIDYYRNGYVVNGLFPGNSYGKSDILGFNDYFFKAGITYKISGRKYIYVNAAFLTQAPYFEDVFISPRSRDSFQENSLSESIQSLEGGYIVNAPSFRFRLTGYYTAFAHGMNVITFYHDDYHSFMNYALSGIGKVHYGTECGVEWQLGSGYALSLSAALGRYYYKGRQLATIIADNDGFVADRELVYTHNFRIPGTPQEAYNVGLGYQNGSWYGNLSGSYFRENWLAFNPLRRTYSALTGVITGSEQWDRIIRQTRLPEQFVIDLLIGSSLPVKLLNNKSSKSILFTASINNLLNNQQIISGGYEQLRFDTDNKNIDKFPPKYFYAMGLNFSISLGLRL